MKRYSDWKPTGFDSVGMGLPERQDWFVVCIGTNRDADCLTESNWTCALAMLDEVDPHGEDHEVHRFGHWACGWFEIVLVRPDSKAHEEGKEIEAALADYPVLSDDHLCELEAKEANRVWEQCYRTRERLEYMRDHWNQFDSCQARWNVSEEGKRLAWRTLLDNVRGRYFSGYASELVDQ